MNISRQIENNKRKGIKMLAILLDPDDYTDKKLLQQVIHEINISLVNFVLIGGSILKTPNTFNTFVSSVKIGCKKPIILFPGSGHQLSKHADALLLLSLISGRNPQFLIGEQVNSAKKINKLGLELLSTGYILVNDSKESSVAKASKTEPIKSADIFLITSTAMAGEQMGMQNIYLEAGSGAKNNINNNIIKNVKNSIVKATLWVGGGIDNVAKAKKTWQAGANILVVGNTVVKNRFLISKLSSTLAHLK